MLPIFFVFLAVGDPRPLPSQIQDVIVYGSTALVHRTARVDGGGSFVLQGLPAALDPSNVRVKSTTGDVGRVEVRSRRESKVPSERLQALRDELAAAERALVALQDDAQVLATLTDALERLARLDARNHARDVQENSGGPEAWRTSLAFLAEQRAELARRGRELRWRTEDAQAAIEAKKQEIGKVQATPDVQVYDVAVELVANAPGTLDLEYFVGRTGWTPAYDVRAAKDLAEVELTYRARIWQDTGEEWNDVALALSTAQPQKGAQGPDPVVAWVDALRPVPAAAAALEAAPAAPGADGGIGGGGGGRGARPGRAAKDYRYKDRADAENDSTSRPFAAVENLGLSARFQLAKNETIPSRRDPTTVLVGEARFPVQCERWCTPALDATVWLRAKTKNASDWVLLPGNASVFLGADFVGKSSIDATQPGQELTLHLGADPALAVTRTQVQDLSKGPAFLSNRGTKLDTWRTRIENHGAATNAKDGAVDVFVREVLPKSRDERIEIAMTKANPPWSTEARWKQDREDKGIHTWVVHVARGGQSDVVVQTTITFPKDAELVRE